MQRALHSNPAASVLRAINSSGRPLSEDHDRISAFDFVTHLLEDVGRGRSGRYRRRWGRCPAASSFTCSWGQRREYREPSGARLKRTIDIAAAAFLLIVLCPLFALIAWLLFLDSGTPIFFSQIRVGRDFRWFWIYKFRSMDRNNCGQAITAAMDPRVTKVGKVLRATKLDELPQLWNVLRGNMSLVGPRPEIPRYVEKFRQRYNNILRLRPGMTDLASLQFSNEERLLSLAPDPLQEYEKVVLPAKLDLADEYVRRHCLSLDISILWRTLCVCFAPHHHGLTTLPQTNTRRS
jgi:lipopolysaccharide/colanic/teichoic acid biosynthesis glycosyltransferase